MKNAQLVLLAVAAIGFGAQTAVAAGDAHSPAAGSSELTLSNGAKWPTDGEVRHGMSEIRALIAEAAPKVNAGRFHATDCQRLANGILGRVESIAANSRLPQEIDAQLDLVLAQIVDGAERIKTGKAPVEGVVTVIGGIEAYGKHFDHPGWEPLEQ